MISSIYFILQAGQESQRVRSMLDHLLRRSHILDQQKKQKQTSAPVNQINPVELLLSRSDHPPLLKKGELFFATEVMLLENSWMLMTRDQNQNQNILWSRKRHLRAN